MSTICKDQIDFTCTCPVPECKDTLILGTISLINTPVFIFIEKQNGAIYVQERISASDGRVTVDLNEPDSAFFNSFDGQYLIWVTRAGGYFCEEDKEIITQEGIQSNTYGLRFEKVGNSKGGSVNIRPIN